VGPDSQRPPAMWASLVSTPSLLEIILGSASTERREIPAGGRGLGRLPGVNKDALDPCASLGTTKGLFGSTLIHMD
jgi:hypothetical protein